jgi:hypothetical protein
MKSSTFKKIVASAKKGGASNPSAVAGKAYWATAKIKYKHRKK